MKIEKKGTYTITTEETILSAAISKENEIVMVLSNGDLARYNFLSNETIKVSSLKDSMGYTDNGFELTEPISIYTLDDIIVIVNNFKRHGYVFNPKQEYRLHLWRGDYHTNITKYPISLYKNDNDVPHLIYADDWNRVQIMNLDTRQVLTAAKSLIEEGAEEKHIEFHKTHEESNKLAWPSTYDYFYGELKISPDNKHFLSSGWVWGSFDYIKAYNINHFIIDNRIKDINIYGGEHESRQICWINANTVAIEHDPYVEGDDEATKETLKEIHLYQIKENTSTLLNKIQIQLKNIKYHNMYFDTTLDAFVLINSNEAVYIVSRTGDVLHQDNTIRTSAYNTTYQQFLEFNEKSVTIYKLV
ncbi:hypothetical protein LNQ81_10730 [Myroides sp. M-43]|uniref:hypothetical protein n=1 Tax=Myroides oncorhynchi TaxID=2893756 RepID=UPI001E5557D4|nr:hypothetical protein [Myroides oncorhynchi]MCC9043148.1 hypothetical protein [Myroides oncorhynchi]